MSGAGQGRADVNSGRGRGASQLVVLRRGKSAVQLSPSSPASRNGHSSGQSQSLVRAFATGERIHYRNFKL